MSCDRTAQIVGRQAPRQGGDVAWQVNTCRLNVPYAAMLLTVRWDVRYRILLSLRQAAIGRYGELCIAATMHRSQLCAGAMRSTVPAPMAVSVLGQRDLRIVTASAGTACAVARVVAARRRVGSIQPQQHLLRLTEIGLDVMMRCGCETWQSPEVARQLEANGETMSSSAQTHSTARPMTAPQFAGLE